MNIMTLHGDCYTLTTRSNPIPPKLIEESGLTYLALGHVHTRRPAAKLGNTTYAYTGSFFGCGFDEPDERGVLVVTIADDGAADTRFVAMSDTCFRNAHLDVTGKSEEEMADEIAAFASHDVYRIYLEGEREVPDIGALTKKCAQHFFHLVLIDRTVPPVDLWEGIEEENLKGEFLRRARAAYDAETDSARKSMLLEAARAGIEALR